MRAQAKRVAETLLEQPPVPVGEGIHLRRTGADDRAGVNLRLQISRCAASVRLRSILLPRYLPADAFANIRLALQPHRFIRIPDFDDAIRRRAFSDPIFRFWAEGDWWGFPFYALTRDAYDFFHEVEMSVINWDTAKVGNGRRLL